LPAVVIRPGQIFGPGAEHVAPNGVIGIGGRWILVGNGSATLPLVFVDDVVDALILAGTRNDVTGKVFNIVDNAVISQQDYLAACAREPRGAPKLIRMPRWLMLCIAWGVEVLGGLLRRNVPLSVYRVRSLRPLSNFDTTAAHEILGWQPAVGARAGLQRTFGPGGSSEQGDTNCA